MRDSIFQYNCETYSIKDIVNFVEEKGFKVEFYDRSDKGASRGFMVVDNNIELRLPNLELFKDESAWNSHGAPCIYWRPLNETYSDLYHAKQAGDKEKIARLQKEYDEYHERAMKLYQQLKRRFKIEKGKVPQAIKDEDYIKELIKKHRGENKKGWWAL
ncbi:hypothetical protein HQ544_02015 [Candidatus Falkowbacteria bacterium]|nr:hypothetical protein [Candidatus Falkowbacteria bacterium]